MPIVSIVKGGARGLETTHTPCVRPLSSAALSQKGQALSCFVLPPKAFHFLFTRIITQQREEGVTFFIIASFLIEGCAGTGAVDEAACASVSQFECESAYREKRKK